VAIIQLDLAGFARTVAADKTGRKGRKLARPKILEKHVKKAILDYLHLKGCFVWNNPSGGAFIPRKPDIAGLIPGGKFIPEGKSPGHFLKFGKEGSPDIVGLIPGGKFIGVEAKASKDDSTGKKRRELQAAFGARITKLGGIYIRAKSVEDVMEVLKPILGGW
jgi:hypothetical protein